MDLIELCGTVAEVMFRNENNGYTVLELHVIETDDKDFLDYTGDMMTTVTGIIPGVNPGETLKIKGKWIKHPDYGFQFKAESFLVEMPASTSGIEKYLASGLLPGIGAIMAKKIVTLFGDKTFEVIEKDPLRLTEIKGMSKKKAEVVHEAFIEQREVTEVVAFFTDYGIGTAFALKLYRLYGSNSIQIVRDNPYRLCDTIKGIGFKTADGVARAMGFSQESKERRHSAIRFVLNEHHGDGHTCLPYEMLVDATVELLRCKKTEIEEALEDLLEGGFLVMEELAGDRLVYTTSFLKAEESVAMRLLNLLEYHRAENEMFESEQRKIESEIGVALSAKQIEAVRTAICNGVSVITGGPGTGKTTVTKAIIDYFEDAGFKVGLAAPTGRAAKRLSEATGREAVTLHRLLEYMVGGDETLGNGFSRDEDNPIDYNVLIVDEVSMVDILLMYSLLKAVPPKCRLILVGDVDQLSSVGPGSVLKDIIDSKIVPVSILKEIFRQSESSKIVLNAHKVNNGEKIDLENNEDSDFFFMKRSRMEMALDTVVALCSERLVGFKGLKREDIQVIAPSKKGICGVKNLNIELQKTLNPPANHKGERKFGDNLYRVGDRVMQTSNNYKIRWESVGNSGSFGEGVYNGDIGVVEEIKDGESTIAVVFDGEKRVRYDYEMLDELDLAYAMTVHKSQGSEYSAVVLPILPGPPMLMTRNLLYTALTRAKKLAVIVGSDGALWSMVENNYQSKRYSGLSERIKHWGTLNE